MSEHNQYLIELRNRLHREIDDRRRQLVGVNQKLKESGEVEPEDQLALFGDICRSAISSAYLTGVPLAQSGLLIAATLLATGASVKSHA